VESRANGSFEFLKVSVANPNLGNCLKMKVLAKEPAKWFTSGLRPRMLSDLSVSPDDHAE